MDKETHKELEETMEHTTTSPLRSLSNQMADAVERVSTALVLVDGRPRQPGSGVIYAHDLVLTAAHILEREADITIQTHDKRTLPAQFVGRDLASDLALLRVKDLNSTSATWANEEVRVGQLTMTVGRSNSEGPMASVGIVSAVGGPLRTNQGIALERYIRTDATPYPGFSGGALIDLNGAVVGILTTGLANGVALAVPATIAQGIADTLAKQGYIKRGYLGISSQLVDIPTGQRAGREQEHGLLIVKVEENSPAQKGGVLLGDILVTLAGHAIKDSEDLHIVLAGDYVGKTIPVEVIRGNAFQTLQVTAGQRQ